MPPQRDQHRRTFCALFALGAALAIGMLGGCARFAPQIDVTDAMRSDVLAKVAQGEMPDGTLVVSSWSDGVARPFEFTVGERRVLTG